MELPKDELISVLVRVPWYDLENFCRTSPQFRSVCKNREAWIRKLAFTIGEPENDLRDEFSLEKGNLKERSLKILAKRGIVTIGSEEYLDDNYCLRYIVDHGDAKEIIHFIDTSVIDCYHVNTIFTRGFSDKNLKSIIEAIFGEYREAFLSGDTSLVMTELLIRGYNKEVLEIFYNGNDHNYDDKRYFSSRVLAAIPGSIPGFGMFLLNHDYDEKKMKYLRLTTFPIRCLGIIHYSRTNPELQNEAEKWIKRFEDEPTKLHGNFNLVFLTIELELMYLNFIGWKNLALDAKVMLSEGFSSFLERGYFNFILECLKRPGNTVEDPIVVELDLDIYLKYQITPLIIGEDGEGIILKTGWKIVRVVPT